MKNLVTRLATKLLRPRFRIARSLPAVAGGPFRGMEIPPELMSQSCNKLMGAYEKELAPIIEELCERPFDDIVDVGAAEGYYAVGFALRFPLANVVAFEMEEWRRKQLSEMATLNGVSERIVIGGACDCALLGETLGAIPKSHRPPLVFVDIEGAEMELLDPCDVPQLRDATIIVELHDLWEQFREAPSLIRERFKATHTITEISAQERTLADFPQHALPFYFPSFLQSQAEQLLLPILSEWRPGPMSWFVMVPKVPNE